MADSTGHVSGDELADFATAGRRVREHVEECAPCRRRLEDVIRLRELLAQTGQRERRPLRDVVPSAMMRLRLRRYSVTNTNELLESFAAFVRGLATLFSLPTTDRRLAGHARVAEDEHDD